jgi:CheY-like chemotaxis protein
MKLEGKKILLVEDDNFVGDMFIRKLKAEGAICSRASNGVEGTQKLVEEKYNFDLIITDVMMAGMDGYEMVKAIKEIDEAKHIPIVVLTNRNSLNEENSRITELTLDGFFIKSDTDLSDIIIALEKIMQANTPTNDSNSSTL